MKVLVTDDSKMARKMVIKTLTEILEDVYQNFLLAIWLCKDEKIGHANAYIEASFYNRALKAKRDFKTWADLSGTEVAEEVDSTELQRAFEASETVDRLLKWFKDKHPKKKAPLKMLKEMNKGLKLFEVAKKLNLDYNTAKANFRFATLELRKVGYAYFE